MLFYRNVQRQTPTFHNQLNARSGNQPRPKETQKQQKLNAETIQGLGVRIAR